MTNCLGVKLYVYIEPRQPRYPDFRVRPKKYLWFRFPDRHYFFCRPYYFFDATKCAALFSPGGCGLLIQRAKMASVVTIIIELCTHNMNNMTLKGFLHQCLTTQL